MNKLTKVGCSALCGSLAAISAASAGDLTATGSAHVTWTSKGGDHTGNPLGFNSGFSLKGNGELDNGWAYALTISHTDGGAYSSANVDLAMGGLGSVNFDQGDSGNGIAAIDDKMPTAWEESWGAGLSTGVRLATGAGMAQNVMYSTPKVMGTTMTFTLAPKYGVTDTAEKTTAAGDNVYNRAYDATININPSFGTEILSGLDVFAGASTIEYHKSATVDNYHAVGGLTYSLGPVSVGFQVTGEYTGDDGDTSGDYNLYKSQAFGVAFNVSDDLSVSYGEFEQRKAGYNTGNGFSQVDNPLRTMTVSSWQVAYTVGGASIRIADSKVTNRSWGTTAYDDATATTLSLGLAF